MDDKRFWSLIEDAWQSIDSSSEARGKLTQGTSSEEDASVLADQAIIEFVPALESLLQSLTREDLLQFDRILERKLYDIDRAEIHEHTDGSDDGFLYARAFMVAMGQGFYEAVSANPSRALMDAECEDLCYLPVRIYSEKFGEMPASDISRESGSNPAGWPDVED